MHLRRTGCRLSSPRARPEVSSIYPFVPFIFQCQFAHGRRELRDVVRNSKYKTKLCQKYWVSGYCAYGPRCNFLHDEDAEMTAFALVEVNAFFLGSRQSPRRGCGVSHVA